MSFSVARFAYVLRPLNNMIILNRHNILPRRGHLLDLANGQGSGRNLIRPLGLLIYVTTLRYPVPPWPPLPQPHKLQAPRRHCGIALYVKTSAHPNILSEIGTPHNFCGSRVAAEIRLNLFIILCQTYGLRVVLQLPSTMLVECRIGVIPVPDPFSGACLAFQGVLNPPLARYVATGK